MKRATPVLLVWLLVAAITGGLLLHAGLAAPPGTAFAGTFYYVDDFYNYLSYVQQAQDGSFLFRNKLGRPEQPALLVNLEWWTVGRLAALMGGHPLVAYRLAGLALLLPMVALADRCLRHAGLPERHRLPALLLVFTGAGLGGWRALAGTPLTRSLDSFAGVYPFIEALANPHFVAGTTLFLAALDAMLRGAPGRGALWAGVLLFVRPYDALLLAGVRTAAVVLIEPPRGWPRALLPLAGLAPAVAYNAWVFFARPEFRVFSSPVFRAFVPSPAVLLWAALPGALLALGAWPSAATGHPARAARLHLLAWAMGAFVFAGTGLASFGLQLLAGAGLPLLALAAIGLSRWPAAVTLAALPVFAATPVTAVRAAWRSNPYWHVPAVDVATATSLRQTCRPGETVLSRPDLGLHVGAFTPCWPYVSHPAAPDYARRLGQVNAFYESGARTAGVATLRRICPEYVVLPPGAAAEAFVGSDGAYSPLPSPRARPVYARRAACAPPATDG